MFFYKPVSCWHFFLLPLFCFIVFFFAVFLTKLVRRDEAASLIKQKHTVVSCNNMLVLKQHWKTPTVTAASDIQKRIHHKCLTCLQRMLPHLAEPESVQGSSFISFIYWECFSEVLAVFLKKDIIKVFSKITREKCPLNKCNLN